MTIHLIQAGFGGRGCGWLKNILQSDLDVKLVAGVDIDSEALQAIHEHNIPSFDQLEEALASVEAEAVLVATSLPSHVPLVQIALEHNKHVYRKNHHFISQNQCIKISMINNEILDDQFVIFNHIFTKQ